MASSEVHILHVDDEPGVAALTSEYLTRHNDQFTVDTANRVDDALTALAEGSYDCIISDYEMPGRDGIAFLEVVREEYGDLPFILFTGKGSEEIASDAISAGVTDYLQKGVGADQYAVLANRIENVVAQHRAEQLVDRAFRAMDESREGIALLDEDGDFIYVNEAYTDIIGYEAGELLGASWELVYPDVQVTRIHEQILETVPEEGRWTGETVYQRKDGERIVVNHGLMYSDEGTMICLVQDRPESVAQQQALHEERQRFDLFIDAVEDYAIFMLDPEGYVISWNRGAERLKGYAQNEILGEHFSTFYPESACQDGLPAALLDRARTEGSVKDRGPRVRKDGTTFEAVVVITAVYDEEGHHRGFGKVTRHVSDTADESA